MPASVDDFAAEAASLASPYGLTPDEWQRDEVLRAWLGRLPDGRWSSPRNGLSVPRQNGKNGALEVRELFGMVGLGERFLHTAHEVKTARKAFLRLASFFENKRKYPELAEMVREIRKTNGQEAIVLTNGGSCEFIARSKGSGRGYTVDVLVCDEAQDLADEQYEALLPTISAAPLGNPQQILTGTPPSESMAGEVFDRMRKDALDGVSSRLSWLEWSCDPGVDLDDPLAWGQANPGLGVRLSLETVGDERAAMSDEGFCRERLGMWGASGSASVVPVELWAGLADPNLRDAGRQVALAVDVSPGRDVATISGASLTVDGVPYVDVLESRVGTPDWVVGYIAARLASNDVRAVVIDGVGPASNLIDQLARAKVRVTVTDARRMAQACGDFYDAAFSGQLRHLDQPVLNVALGAGRKRKLGDGWAWHRLNAESDITPLVSSTLALWGLVSSEARKPRMRSGKAVFA